VALPVRCTVVVEDYFNPPSMKSSNSYPAAVFLLIVEPPVTIPEGGLVFMEVLAL
jgi:hypothetical protein